MTTTNFAYFMQGFFELEDPKSISSEKLAQIKGHLKLVFRDDIDHSHGGASHQEELNQAHQGYPFKLEPGEKC